MSRFVVDYRGQLLLGRWILPLRGFVKINVAAYIAKNSSITSVAAVARDDIGRFIRAFCSNVGGQH